MEELNFTKPQEKWDLCLICYRSSLFLTCYPQIALPPVPCVQSMK